VLVLVSWASQFLLGLNGMADPWTRKHLDSWTGMPLFHFLRKSCYHYFPGYRVEKRRPGGSWEKATDSPVTGESCTIPDLDEGKEYEFRVAAITGAGVGDYSLNTMPVKVCEKKGDLELPEVTLYWNMWCGWDDPSTFTLKSR